MHLPNQQPSEIWRPLTGMPEGAHSWLVPGYAELSEAWASVRASLKHRDEPRAFLRQVAGGARPGVRH